MSILTGRRSNSKTSHAASHSDEGAVSHAEGTAAAFLSKRQRQHATEEVARDRAGCCSISALYCGLQLYLSPCAALLQLIVARPAGQGLLS